MKHEGIQDCGALSSSATEMRIRIDGAFTSFDIALGSLNEVEAMDTSLWLGDTGASQNLNTQQWEHHSIMAGWKENLQQYMAGSDQS